jgi:CheY-like chemotaxis protein
MKYIATFSLLLLATVAQAASPAVNATLSLPRTQPRHFVEAALTLLDLGAPEEAEKIVAELAGQPLTDEQYVALVDQVGTAALARLGREVPAAAPVVDKALAAASAAATSPARMQGLVNQLTGEREQALAAIRALRLTGPSGVDYCMTQLAKADDPKLRARLREALVALDPLSQPAIFAATGSDNPAVATEAAYALGRLAELGRIRSPIAAALVAGRVGQPGPAGEAAHWAYGKLTGKLPTDEDALRRLDVAIDELLAGAVLFTDGVEAPANFNVQLAARLAADQAALLPGGGRPARRAMLLALENGNEGAIATAPTEDVSAVLGDSLTRNLHTAARLAAQTLGQRGDEAALYAANGELSPLAKALESPHPAVRFAAVEAIVAINPQNPFAGSSRLADALLYFAAAEGDDIAVVASPQLARAGETAGWLMGAGYVALPANRGEDALRIATASPDTTLVLIDMSVSLPGARETIFRLRRSPETALVPIAVLAADGRLAEAQRIADEHGGEAAGIIALPRPHSPEATASMAQRLVALAPADWPHADERLRHAEAAKKAIAGLIANGPKIYGFDRRAEQVAIIAGLGKSEESLATLAALGTPESQQRLLDAASLEARPLADRSAAADAFAESVAAHGILLTTDQLRRQYDRYNLSATAPEETQAVLGRLLDVIERKTANE